MIQLIEQDCIAGMRGMNPESVNCIVTSPPYNLGIAYSKYDDKLPDPEYLQFMRSSAEAMLTVLKPDGHLFLNLAGSLKLPLQPYKVLEEFLDSGFVLQNTIHWIKSMAFPTDEGEIQRGHYKPVNSARFLNSCAEFVFHLTKTGSAPLDRLAIGIPYADKSNVARFNRESDLKCRGNVWFIPYETINRRLTDRPHPATFPIELAERCIRVSGCAKGSLVLDPFVGLGTSALAAHNVGADFVGFDIDAEYIRAANERLAIHVKENS